MNETVMYADPQQVTPRAWIAVCALGVSAFTIVSSELAPVGMLIPLARDMSQTEAGAGMVVTAYAWVAALAALLSTALPAQLSRKYLLTGLMLVLAVSATVASQATLFSTLISARMVGALAHGAFWAMIGSLAAQLVPASRLGLATAVIFGGVSAASVLSVPMTHLLAGLSSWRDVFRVVAGLALATAFALHWTLPRLKPAPATSLAIMQSALRNPVIIRLYIVTVCAITAHFMAFTWLEPLLAQALHVPATAVMSLLMVFGVSGLLGNIIAGKCVDRHLKLAVGLALIFSGLALFGLALMINHRASLVLVAALLAVWSASMALIFVGLQTWLLRVAGSAVQPASALYVALFNAAIGGGALAGGQLMGILGLPGVILTAAAAIVIAAVLVTCLTRPASLS